MNKTFKELHEINVSHEYTRSHNARYIAEIRHKGLGTIRILKDLDNHVLKNKVVAQFKKWDEQYAKLLKREAQEENKVTAQERSVEAQEIQDQIKNLLVHILDIDHTIDWNTLKDNSTFNISKPRKPQPPTLEDLPKEPSKSKFEPKLSFLEKLIKSLGQKKINSAEKRYRWAIDDWEKEIENIISKNNELTSEYERKLQEYEILVKKWEDQKESFYSEQKQAHLNVDKLKLVYEQHNQKAVIQYCKLVLSNSEYPNMFPQDFNLDYNPENKLLIVEYILPAPETLPTLNEVKFIATRNEFKESHLSETQIAEIFDQTIYKITLRTLYELFVADQANAIDAVVFNGWVEALNKATGRNETSCIVSIQVKKKEFMEIDLARVDPKACFKGLKGVSSSKLSGITAIQPIAQIEKHDKRFVASKDVSNQLDEGYNLAAMDWEDFEHLLREIFQKEFNANGGEVKVTQASRDGGVDAIAFDPDPIRGGKIVIQAKRYTNTVGVSAVRDLYGTVMNEGATKGILVTTSDYGPDAYDFAKNKPLTLINGSNLLYILERHGHQARINIAEAKRKMKEG